MRFCERGFGTVPNVYNMQMYIRSTPYTMKRGKNMLRIITDSATDLPKDYVNAHHLHVIPTPVVIDDVDYFDGETIQTKEFYDILDDMNRSIRTYHINPEMFENAFRPYAQAGDTVIYVCFSTGIAGTYNAANIAKSNILEEYPDFDLTIIDSKCASIGFGLLVSKLVTMLENGADKKTIIEAADYFIEHMHILFTVRTLNYLIKGGRLSKFSGTIGETLDIKPIITVDKEGKLSVLQKVRGTKKAYKTIAEMVKADAYDISHQTIAICHGEDEQAFETAKRILEKECGKPGEYFEAVVGCAIGAHTGRGIVGMCFLDADDGPYAEYFVS